MQASGAEKIANLFNVSWRIDEPGFEAEEDGHYVYSYRGTFSTAGRSIQIEGSRSSKDPFFRQYDWKDNIKKERAIYDRDNKRDVKMAALTNLLGNGITRLLGIRNLTYADLEAFADIKRTDIGRVEYKKEGKKIGDSVRKKPPTTKDGKIAVAQLNAIDAMLEKIGIAKEDKCTYLAKALGISELKAGSDLSETQGAILIQKLQKAPEKEEGGELPTGCTKDPRSCEASGWVSENDVQVAYCAENEKPCPYQEG